jgi:parvulin-like peptidyl-prolyl isomerase
MPNQHKFFLKFVYWALAIILVLAILSVVWLYSGTLTHAKIKIFQTVPLPMALVNGHPLSMQDFLIRFSVAQKTLGQSNGQQTKFAIVQQLILEAEVSQLAQQRDVSVSQKQIGDEYLVLSEQTNLQGQTDFKNLLLSQNLDEGIFKNNVIKPELLFNQLRIWFNSQAGLNPQAYQLANGLIEQINGGKDMTALASQFSEDPAGKSSGGDMGFVQITDLSGELRESVANMKPGEAKIIPGLYGLYIIRLEQETGNQLHLREIFLNTADFNSWLGSQTKKFKIINLLTI